MQTFRYNGHNHIIVVSNTNTLVYLLSHLCYLDAQPLKQTNKHTLDPYISIKSLKRNS